MLLVSIFDVVADQCLITALLLLSCQYAKRSFSIFSDETDQSRLCFVFFSHKWREAAYCIAAVEANASSVLLITCTQTRSPLHIGILPLVEQPILFLNEFAYSFSPFASWPPSPVLYFSHFIPLFYSFSVALIHFQRQQHSWSYCQFLSLSLWPNMVLQAPTLLGITALLAFA